MYVVLRGFGPERIYGREGVFIETRDCARAPVGDVQVIPLDEYVTRIRKVWIGRARRKIRMRSDSGGGYIPHQERS